MALPKYADWQPCFLDYFGATMKSLNIVELGKGEGTIFLHKNFNSVVTIEYSRFEYISSWEENGLPGHQMEVLEVSPTYIRYDDIVINTRGIVRNKMLILEAYRLYQSAIKHKADILFIDHGAHNRGEVLDLAKRHNWKYIIVHDTNHPYYNYQLESERHKTTYYKEGQGTAILKLTV